MGCVATGQLDMPVQCQINTEKSTGAHVNPSQNVGDGAKMRAINFKPLYHDRSAILKQKNADFILAALQRYDSISNKDMHWKK